MDLYLYEGPVVMFGRIISQKWVGQTKAFSKTKALNNLKYQYKKSHNMIASSKIEFRGEIVKVDKRKE